MKDLTSRLSTLSPAQRKLLELRLRKKALDLDTLERRAVERDAEGEDGAPRPIPPRPEEGPWPLTPDQERLVFLHRLHPDTPFYNLFSAERFRGRLDPARLRHALAEVVRRHEILRSRIVDLDGIPHQDVLPPFSPRVPVVDLDALRPQDANVEGDRQVRAFLAEPFDLAQPPLFRTALLELPGGELLWPVSFHHAVIDWVSTFLFRRELAALYADPATALPPLTTQFADVAVWLRERQAGAALRAHLDAWREHLRGAPEVTELPRDRPRPTVQSGVGRRRRVRVPHAASDCLRRLARARGTTLFMAHLALLDILITRLTGQSRLVVGTPLTARPHPDTEPLIGYFLRHLPVLTDLSGDPTVATALERVRQAVLFTFRHQEVPFSQLVEIADPERDLSRPPLAQLTLLFLNPQELDSPQLPGLEPLPYTSDDESAKFDLTLTLWDHPAFEGFAEYDSALFDGATVERFLRTWSRLLTGAAEAPEARLSELPLLGPGERHQIVAELDDTTRSVAEASLPELVAEQARRTPDAVALAAGSELWTYAHLDAATSRVASGLQGANLAPETRVGIAVSRHPELIAALLGVLRAGAAYVPLDLAFPARRLATIARDAELALILHDAPLPDVLAEAAPPKQLDALLQAAPAATFNADLTSPQLDALAYVLHTSGSTGRPKGVQISHRSLVNFLVSMVDAPGISPGDVLVALTTISFDIAGLELFAPLLVGARVEIASRGEGADPRRLAALVAQRRASVVQATPATWRMLVDSGWTGAPIVALCGGEALPPDLAREVMARCAGMWNLYGPTETTVYSTIRQIDPAVLSAGAPLSVGRPIANTRAVVLDQNLRLLPFGATGDLLLGGVGLARGYLGRPTLTADAFIPDPLAGTSILAPAGGRLYRTGDRARLRADGEVVLLGRADHQVKVRGFRIELGEIEGQMRRLHGIADAVVVPRSAPAGAWLMAWLVPDPEVEAPDGAALRQALSETLPPYMVPARFVPLEALPLTPNGKVDRKSLTERPLPDNDGDGDAPRGAPPSTPDELLVAQIFAQVLELAAVEDAERSFFELGGHSLLAARVLARLREAVGIEIALDAFFGAPSVAGVARALVASRATEEGDEGAGETGGLPPILPRARPKAAGSAPERLPLTLTQERLWLAAQIGPASAFNVPISRYLDGPLDPARLFAAAAAVAARHESLRSRFPAAPAAPHEGGGGGVGEGVVQEILDRPSRPGALVDLGGLPEAARHEALATLGDAVIGTPFDLATAPPWRLALARLDPGHHALLAVFHHLICDAWSLEVWSGELAALYRAKPSEGDTAQGDTALPPLPIQLGDVALEQRARFDGRLLEREIAFWRGRLAGAPVELELPRDRPRPTTPSGRGERRPFSLDAEISASLTQVGARHGATFFMALLASFGALLARLSGRTDVVLGTPWAGRDRPQLEGLIGFFVNTLPLRLDLGGAPDLGTAIQRARDTVLEAVQHREIPFETLVEETRPQRRPGLPPIVQVMFAFQNVPRANLCLGDLRMRPLATRPGRTAYDLGIALSADAAGLEGELEWSTELFDATTVERFLGAWRRLLKTWPAAPELRLEALEILAPAERHQVLVEWNDTDLPYASELSLGEAFARSAAATPDAIALVTSERGADQAWTYAALLDAARELAAALRARGLRPEEPIGLFFERSTEMVTATLGTSLAGGACVPLDPSYPETRLQFMIELTSLARILTPKPSRSQQVLPSLEKGGWGGFPAPSGLRLWERQAPEDQAPEDQAQKNQPEPAPLGEAQIDPSQVATIFFTSGSTGQPKGIAVPHRGIHRLATSTPLFHLAPGDRMAFLANVAFDASSVELWSPLVNSATVVALPPGLDPKATADVIVRQRISHMAPTTALFNELAIAETRAFDVLRHAGFGGEAADVHAVQTARIRLPRGVKNFYGPTENSTISTWHPVHELAADAHRVPIGRALPNSQASLYDRHLHAVGLGTTGEICVAGDGLARGYVARPARTALVFVPDPGSQRAGERLYRTGDLARWSADGLLEFLGRRDAQVKVSGFRIEPGEIEACLVTHPGVERAAVSAPAAADGQGPRRLVAWIVPAADAKPSDEELHDFLTERLPPHLVPSLFGTLDALPFTANGKIDRAALEARNPRQAHAYTAPRTALETRLAQIWSEVLGVEQIGIEDDFFLLGGHSLQALRLAGRVHAATGIELPLRDLFVHRTVAAMARALEDAGVDGDVEHTAYGAILPREFGQSPAPSFAQERLWLVDRMAPGRADYNVAAALHLRGPLQADALAAAWRAVVARHETLRSTFPADVDGRLRLERTTGIRAAQMARVELSHLAPERRDAELRRQAVLEGRRPFDLAAGPLARAALLRLAEDHHGLLLNQHHIVSDGWSTGVLIAELRALYTAARDGAPGPPPPAIQYSDFAAWQRERFAGPHLDAALDAWRRRLEGLASLELPADRPRRNGAARGGVVELRLPRIAAEAIEARARGLGGTPFMAWLALFGAFLGRLTQRRDLAVGTPIANRGRAELEDLLGFFVNTLVLRLDLSATAGTTPNLDTLVERVRQVLIDVEDHQDLPFERLVAELNPERQSGATPWIQAVFTYQDTAQLTGHEIPGVRTERLEIPDTSSKFDLMVGLAPGPAGLTMAWQFQRALFDETTVQRFARGFAALLESAVAEPERDFEGLEILTQPERHALLVELTDTAAPYPELPLDQLFGARAADMPESIALVFGQEHLSYGELARRADAWGLALAELGVAPESRVGLCLERSAELVTAILAVVRVGAVYVPLDPSHPPERLAWLLENTDVAVVLTQRASRETLPNTIETPVVELPLSSRPSAIQSQGLKICPSAQDTNRLAYIMYTSGSTGRPKGIGVTHRGVARLVLGTDYVRLGADDRLGHLSNTAFDASTFEIWGALLHGGTIVGLERDEVLDPQRFADALQERRVSATFLTVALFNLTAAVRPDAFATFEHLLVGGEAVDPNAARRVLGGPAPPRRLLNGYGPTESTTFAVCHPIRQVAPDATSVPIGRAIANTWVYVLDHRLQPMPLGATGELWIAGHGLARGYWQRPALTAERFVPDPFTRAHAADQGGARLYKSGDLVRLRPADGVIDFIGRADFQVKIRGFRIELGEIEAALLEQPRVRQALVLALDSGGGLRLAACVGLGTQDADTQDANARDDSSQDQEGRDQDVADTLRTALERSLPANMVPTAFVIRHALPMTPNGKLDRKRLTEEAHQALSSGSAMDAGAQAPRTTLEATVAKTWREVLGIEHLNVDDDFFTLGGHSLLATLVTARLSRDLGREVPIHALFDHPTVATLAAHLAEDLERAPVHARSRPALVPSGPADGAPLSFAQERMWLLARLEPESAAYNMPIVLRLTGELHATALDASLRALAQRHAVLRARFVEEGEEPRMRVAPLPPATVFPSGAVPRIDLENLGEQASGEARRLLADLTRRPFALDTRPPWQAALLRHSSLHHLLLLNLHHILADGWSLGVLVDELAALYPAALEAQPACPVPSPLPPLTVQYADVTRWQRGWLRGEVLATLLDSWRQRLAGAPPLELPADRPRPTSPSGLGRVRRQTWSRELLEHLRQLAHGAGTTLFTALAAGFAACARRLTGQADVVFGTAVANRGMPALEGVVGMLVNTLALRFALPGDPTFGEILAQTHERALDALERQDLPFEKLVAELDLARDSAAPPVVQVLVTLQNTPLGALTLPGLEIEPVAPPRTVARLDLTLSLAEDPTTGTLAVSAEADADLFDSATVDRLLSAWRRLLTSAAPERRLGELELFSPAERHQLYIELTDTAVPYPKAPLEEIFARRSCAVPDAIAVVHGFDHLSYAELARRADSLARHLATLGVGDESRVGLCLERSTELILAILAVLRAGGVYVPLDPSHPPERLAVLLEDSGMVLVLAHATTRQALPQDLEVPVVEILADTNTEPGVSLLTSEEALPAEQISAPTASTDRLAYVMFTSGSTGRPKGIGIPHHGVARLVLGTQHLRAAPGSRIAFVINIAFDASTFEIWGALLNGYTLVVLERDDILEADAFADTVLTRHVSHLHMTTAHFNHMARQRPDAFGGLEDLIFGGEAVDPGSARRTLESASPPGRMLNFYGPTEGTTLATWHHVRLPAVGTARPLRGTSVPIGRAVVNTWLHLLDRYLRPVPLGVIGELCIGGDGLARGYLGRPALTAASFVPASFPPPGSRRTHERLPGGERLYKSGDLVRRRPVDGVFEFIGRADFQVKVRGFRIELGEIEAQLGELPEVAETAVEVRETAAGKEIVAWLVPAREGAKLNLPSLREALGRRLPAYMVPARFLVLDAMPLNPNGKVDRAVLSRRALPERETAQEAGTGLGAASATPLEELISGIWEDLLDRRAIGPEESFFALGGHSLLATRVVARLRERLGVEVPLRALFDTPTVRGLAAAVEAARGVEALPPVVPVSRPGDHGFDDDFPEGLPLSFSQERLFVLDLLGSKDGQAGSTALNMPISTRLTGTLDVAALRRALDRLSARHEILRTTYARVDGVARQHITPPRPGTHFPLGLVDLMALPEPARAAEAERCQAFEARATFDLEHGPVARAALLRLDAEHHVLVVDEHHIASDGWSITRLVEEAMLFYTTELDATSTKPLEPLAIQYADYATWQRRELGPHLARQVEHWRQRLAGAPPLLELPTDRPRPAIQTFRGAHHPVLLPPSLAEPLHRLARDRASTLFMVLLAGFKALLGRLAGQDDVLVGTPVAGRVRHELEPLLGCFLNSLTLRTELSGNPSFLDLMDRVRGVSLDAYAHQDVPFERLLEELQPARELSHTPFFQVVFNLLSFPARRLELPGLRVEPTGQPPVEAKFDLTIYARELDDGTIGLNLVYNADLFDASRIDEMGRQYVALLEQAAARPGDAMAAHSLLTASARNVLPDPTAPLARDWRGSVPELAAHWAQRTPDAPAALDDAGSLSYSEVAHLARWLAAELATDGVTKGDVVTILAQRHISLVWALLGVLETGAAFVLLDPAYPPARLAEMVRQASPALWLELASREGELPAELESVLAGTPRRVLPARETWPELPEMPPRDPEIRPDDLAYIAFTSGSTGTPKGIRGRHGSLTHFTPWMAETYGLGSGDRYSLLSGLAHDPLHRDVFTPLQLGGTVVIPDPAQMLRSGYLARWLAKQRIHVANLTPAMAQVVAEVGDGEPPKLSDLRLAFLVGDVLTRRDVARLVDLAPNVECINHYGSTETQRAVSYHRTRPEDIANAASDADRGAQVLPLGRGIPGVQLLVRRPGGELAGLGEVGEIAVRSPHVALGYLDLQETEQRFVTNPATGESWDRLYLTGDLGRYLPDGEVSFVGRADQQVKIRGFRIELGEIEAALGHCKGVAEAVVLLRREEGSAPLLAAWVVTDTGAGVDLAALRTELSGEVPGYMVPTTFEALDALPLTPNGKIDRAALARRALPELASSGDFAPPTGDLEERLVELWKEILGLERVGVRDNFFDLGGHSLLLVRLHARLEALLERPVPLMDLFRLPTVRALAEHLDESAKPSTPKQTIAAARDRGARQRQAMRKKRPRLGPKKRK